MRDLIDVTTFNRGFFDISYGEVSETLKLDVFLPNEGEGPFPVIISIHGGAFKMGDKRNGEAIEPMLKGLEKGYAVVGLNYRLSGEAIFPLPVQDIKRGIRFIKKHSNQYSLDPERIIVWGGSAGGYMTLMASVFEEVSLFDDPKDPNANLKANVCGVVSWFPPTNFTEMDAQLAKSGLLRKNPDHSGETSPESLFLGQPILTCKELVGAANPATYIHANMPDLLIQHGRLDRIVPYQQSKEFVDKVNTFYGTEKAKYQILEGADHGSPEFETEENLEIVFDFIKQVLNK